MTAPITPDAARELAVKATPGPWVADETDPADVVVWASRDFAHDDELIANIGHAIQPVNVAFDCDAANARLIAAAPTLATLYADQADELAKAREENARLREGLTVAAMDVLLERLRQITVEGWTSKHDDLHCNGEMAQAAACYADPAPKMWADPRITTPVRWPQEWASWWKPKSRRRNLVRAGALILAEIERLDRAALSGETP